MVLGVDQTSMHRGWIAAHCYTCTCGHAMLHPFPEPMLAHLTACTPTEWSMKLKTWPTSKPVSSRLLVGAYSLPPVSWLLARGIHCKGRCCDRGGCARSLAASVQADLLQAFCWTRLLVIRAVMGPSTKHRSCTCLQYQSRRQHYGRGGKVLWQYITMAAPNQGKGKRPRSSLRMWIRAAL